MHNSAAILGLYTAATNNGTDVAYYMHAFKSGSKLLVLILETGCRFESVRRDLLVRANAKRRAVL